jgi:cytoskeleton protein RodZ
MSSVEDSGNENPSPKAGIGPGERLQAARIKKGLSLEDVANRMHLSASILEAIEVNDFDEITAPIFVKGYLRAYARIVALSEDEMIQQYIDLYSEEDPPISSTSNMVPELSVTDARIKWTTYLVIVVLAVLLAAWWWNKQQNEEVLISLDAQSSRVEDSASSEQPVVDSDIQAESEAAISSAATPETEPEPAELVTEDQQTPTEELPETMVEPVAAVMDEAPAAAEPVEINAEAEPEADTQTESSSVADPSESAEVAMEEEAGTRPQGITAAPSGSDRLRIIVHADTWADVKDANNHQLVYDLLRADSKTELSGEAPFTVFLGNGHGVELELNGDEVDISSKIRDNNTVRLDIGG